MKHKPKELDVDFVGGQEPLRAEKAQKISEHFQSQKLLRRKRTSSKKSETRKKVA